jgi:predicted enzyme related to lactoylglutathione lyase
MQPPTDIPPGRMAVNVDPAGAIFSVIKMAQPGD